MTEEWRTCVYEGEIFENYEVSDGGKIRRKNYRGTGKPKELKPYSDKSVGGYLKVKIFKNYKDDKKGKSCSIQRLVAFTYPDKIPNDNPTEKTQVNHINENKHDNRVENLEWVTPKENMQHGTRTERQAKGHYKKIKCIELDKIFDSIKQASEETGCDRSAITKVCKGKMEKVKGYHFEYVD